MIVSFRTAVCLLGVLSLAAGAGRQGDVDPALRASIDRFFAAQQSEDIQGYLALWSADARRPTAEQLAFVFESGDDTFSDITIVKVMPFGDRMRVRVAAVRDRTQQHRIPGRPPTNRRSQMLISLTYVRDGADWKLLREGPASDDLALALIESQSLGERQQLLAAEPELLGDSLLLSISRRGVEASQTADFSGAQLAYARMLEVARYIGNRKYEGEALQNLGNTYYFQRQFPAALEAYEQRLAIERERANDEGIAAALAGVATIRYSLAEYGAALAAYREALALQERLGDEPAAATTLISTGNVLYLQGDFEAAISDYRRSRELSRRNLNTQGEADALEGLGRVFLARGDYAGALEAFAGVLAEGRARSNRRTQGSATLNIGEVHFRLGNLEAARSTFEESRGHFEAMKDAANVGRVWQAVALTDLVAGRFTVAESEYRKSIERCVSVSDQECVAGATVGLGFAQTAQDRFVDAIASYTKAIEAFTRLGRREQTARAGIGLAQALSGHEQHKAAVEAAVRARRAAVALENDDVLWRALIAEARGLRRLGERQAALGAAAAARSALHRLVATATVRPATPVPRDSSSVFALLAVLHAESGDAAAAFEAAEEMRAHSLRIVLSPAEREIARGMTALEREEERALSVELVSLHAQLTREQALPKPDAARLERLQQAVRASAEKRTAQQDRLFRRLPDLRIWRGLISPATRTDVSAVLESDQTVVVQFVVDEEDLLLISARMGEDGPEFAADVQPVARRALAEGVARLMTDANLRSPEDWRKASRELLDSVIAPLTGTLSGATDVILVPHEILWRVPFQALPVGDGDIGSATRLLTYAPSVTALVRTPVSSGPPTSGASGVLLAGAPDLAAALRERVAQIAPTWTIRPPESADREMSAVAEVIDPASLTALRGPQVSETALRELMPGARAIHVAAPFRINGASPLFSPLLLAEEKNADPPGSRSDSASDGSLDAREIMNLTLGAQVAVLSDGSAMSMRDAADDAVMIQWAWRAAGVPHLLVARWMTDVPAADQLLAVFHRRLSDGDPPAVALRAAQKAVRGTDLQSAPHYWAGWMLLSGR